MKLTLLICLFGLSLNAFSQDSVLNKKWHYFGLHQIGVLAGSSEDRLGVLTTNGISKGNWHTGISTGIDWYGIRTIPLLASVYKTFGKAPNQLFAYTHAGISFPWVQDRSSQYYSYHYKNGFIGEAGLGYSISLKNKTAFTVSAGYSYKMVKAEESYMIIYDFPPYNDPDYSKSNYKYNYRRIAIRLGIKI